jgi:hypothetical protein
VGKWADRSAVQYRGFGQVTQLLGIARISTTQAEYEGYFQKLFGEQLTLFTDDKGR